MFQDRVHEFLAQQHIAVAGVSSEKEDAANLIFRKLRAAGHTVYAINPKVQSIGGEPCYPDLKSLPTKPQAVVMVTRPEVSETIVHECAELGISHVWMHRSPMGNSASDKAVQFCEEHHISVIASGCPMMYCEPVDFGHKCMRWIGQVTGGIPKV